jgi:antitoxin ParD1/3/4
MTMHINLSPEMEGFIKNLVKSGEYGNATEVIRDAIRRLKAHEMHKAAWRHAIEQGEEGDAHGDVTYNSESARQITRDAERTIADSDSIDPDVVP